MTITLKDGTSVEDIRLDRLVQFDERSREFPVRELPKVAAAKKPRSYTWRCDSFLNQGSEGACVGFGWAHELAARPSVVAKVSDEFARQRIYYEAQKIDPWPGGAYPSAFPRYEGTSVLAGAKICHGLGAFGEYRWAFGLEDLIMGVGYAGPAVLGLDWYEGMCRPNEAGYLNTTGSIVGGHCLIAKAVSVKEKRFTVHNSWGQGWGKDSSAYIDFDTMGHLLDSQGEACIPVGRKKIKL